MRHTLVIIIIMLTVAVSHAAANPSLKPDWETIKQNAMPRVALPDAYGVPYLQPHSTIAWEDGVFISRDGLTLYATYIPADILQYIGYVAENPICPDITPFLRGPLLDMDLEHNPWGCENILHSDIAYSTRQSISEPFSPWQLSTIASPYRYDGGFQALDNPDGTIDVVFSASTDSHANDLYWARNVLHNPTLEAFSPLPPPIQTPAQEDNPHLERLGPETLVLLFDNHGVGDPTTTIKFSISDDNGATWSEAQTLNATINAGPHDIQPHLFHDGGGWWLYFASERNGTLSIYRSQHTDSDNIATNFDDWGEPQLVIEPGTIEGNLAAMIAVGEPTLTEQGDISFVAVYYAIENSTPFDTFEIDAWLLPRK